MDNGWIKLHRKLLDNPVVCKDGDHVAVWIYLLLQATHEAYSVLFKGEKITLKPGQLLTGRKAISQKLNIGESKVQRILNLFKIEQQIEQQSSNKNRLITIVKWGDYQQAEQQTEQQVNNKRTTSEQQVNTNKNVKNIKNDKNNIYPPYPLMEFGFSSVMEKQIHIWLKYKQEKKDKYTETGFRALLTKIKKHIDQYGEQTVIDIINESMSNNWKGIIWDRIKTNKEVNPFKEELRRQANEQSRGNSSHGSNQNSLSKLLQEPSRD